MNEVNAIISQTMEQLNASRFNAPAKMDDMAKAEAAAKDFEAVFMSQMLTPMFEGLKPDPMFGGGHAEEIYQSLIIQEYGKILAERGGIGIADSVKQTILEMQSKQSANPFEGEVE